MSPDDLATPSVASTRRAGGLSMLMGFAIGWAILIVTPVLAWIVMMLFAEWLGPSSHAFQLLLPGFTASPLLVAGAVALYFGLRGKRRAAIGIGIAVASAVALALLLVAACFGIIAINQ